jgi:hypothetical protein
VQSRRSCRVKRGCDLLILLFESTSKDRSLRQLLRGPVQSRRSCRVKRGCDLLILLFKSTSKDRSLRQLLQVITGLRDRPKGKSRAHAHH